MLVAPKGDKVGDMESRLELSGQSGRVFITDLKRYHRAHITEDCRPHFLVELLHVLVSEDEIEAVPVRFRESVLESQSKGFSSTLQPEHSADVILEDIGYADAAPHGVM